LFSEWTSPGRSLLFLPYFLLVVRFLRVNVVKTLLTFRCFWWTSSRRSLALFVGFVFLFLFFCWLCFSFIFFF